jgi:replicative DNA helicase
MLSDLRDCLAGSTLVANADTGERVPMSAIVDDGLRFNVWAMDERMRLVRRPITDAWHVASKAVFDVRTQSGRRIRCTAGHRFRTVSGWSELRDLSLGEAIAAPRSLHAPELGQATMTQGRALLLGWLIGAGHLGGSATLTVATAEEAKLAADLARAEFGIEPSIKPERAGTSALRVAMTTGPMSGAGKNPLPTWLRELGIGKSVGSAKSVPAAMFGQPDDVVAAFVRGLYHADGGLTRGSTSSRVTVRLATISESLARGVQHLLLRFGINATLKCDERNIGGYRTSTSCMWTLALMERPAVCLFMDTIGFLGDKHLKALGKIVWEKANDADQFDRIPVRAERGRSHAALGWRDQGKAMARATCAMVAERLDDDILASLAYSDILWDPIVSIEPAGTEHVYDLTVGELHNFVVDDILTHNSGAIEQEADIVTFLYRDAYYNKETSPEPDATEFIFAKHRNGKVGTVKLRFKPEHTLFQPYGDDSHYPAP